MRHLKFGDTFTENEADGMNKTKDLYGFDHSIPERDEEMENLWKDLPEDRYSNHFEPQVTLIYDEDFITILHMVHDIKPLEIFNSEFGSQMCAAYIRDETINDAYKEYLREQVPDHIKLVDFLDVRAELRTELFANR